MESLTTESEYKSYREKAITVCGQFIRGHWVGLKDEDIELKEIIGGCINRVYICEIIKTDIKLDDETPKKVIIRFLEQKKFAGLYEDKNFAVDIKYVGEAAEAVMFNILSKHGIGPKLWGVFPGGRIEEFIQSHHPSDEEYKDPKIYSGIMRKLAKFHSLQAPIAKENFYESKFLDKFLVDIEKNELLKNLDFKEIKDPKYRELARETFAFNKKAEVDWIKQTIKKLDLPVRLCHNDPQRLNTLIRDDSEDDEHGSIVLIDLDTVGYNFRGYDLGYFFFQQVFDARNAGPDQNFLTENPFPTEDYRKAVIRSYLIEWKKVAPRELVNNMDTEEHLYMEAFLGSILNNLVFHLMMMKDFEKSFFKSEFLQFWNFYAYQVRKHNELKEEFCRKYSKLIE